MRPIETADDVAALTREELWRARREDLKVLQEYPYGLTSQFNARVTELLPDVVDLVAAVKREYDSGRRDGAAFAPIRGLPPFPLIFAWTQLVKGGVSDLAFCRHAHLHLVHDIARTFGFKVGEPSP